MITRTDKTEDNKNKVAANAASGKPAVSALQFADNRPEANTLRQLQAMADKHVAQSQPPIQRFLSHEGKQYRNIGEVMRSNSAYKLYTETKDMEGFMKKLADATAVYDMITLEKTDEKPEPIEVKEMEKVSIKGMPKTADILAKEADAEDMKKIEAKLSAATVTFKGGRWKAHLVDEGGDKTAKLSKAEVEGIIKAAKAADMSGAGGAGLSGGKTIRIVYDHGEKLSVVFEYHEKENIADVFHVGPGG